MSSLRQRSVDGVIWNLLEKMGVHFIRLILGVILARLLTPTDYGLIGMVTVFFVFANVFIDSGFALAYIQKKNATEIDASTIFFFNLFISIIFYVILWFSAPFIAGFYNEPQLINLVRAMSVVVLINAFRIMQIAKLTKEVNFRKKTIIMMVSALMSGSLGIVAALSNYGVWSLVVQSISSAFLLTLGLWIFYKWKPLLTFNIESLKSLFSFSSWSLLSEIIRALFDNFYILVIGKYYPAAELGFYFKANQFEQLITKQFSKAITTVAFPVFSQLQDDNIRLKNAMKKFNQHSFFFIFPIAAILIVIAEPFFLMLLTEKWLPMVPYFQLLLVAGIWYPMHAVNVQVMSAQGKVRLNFKIEQIKNVLKVTNVLIMFRYGVIYIIAGEIIFSFLALIINTYYTQRYVNYGIVEQLKDVFEIILLFIVVVIAGFFVASYIENDYIKMVITALFMAILYMIGMYYLKRKVFLDSTEIIKKKLSKS